MANGRDDRAVTVDHERKSIGSETTFPRDLPDGPELRSEVDRLVRDVASSLQKRQTLAKTVVLKLRYRNFRTITRQTSRPAPTNDGGEILAAANGLLDAAVQEGDMFRLIGVQCTNLSYDEAEAGQLRLAAEH
jgi:DNA polymerase-4